MLTSGEELVRLARREHPARNFLLPRLIDGETVGFVLDEREPMFMGTFTTAWLAANRTCAVGAPGVCRRRHGWADPRSSCAHAPGTRGSMARGRRPQRQASADFNVTGFFPS